MDKLPVILIRNRYQSQILLLIFAFSLCKSLNQFNKMERCKRNDFNHFHSNHYSKKRYILFVKYSPTNLRQFKLQLYKFSLLPLCKKINDQILLFFTKFSKFFKYWKKKPQWTLSEIVKIFHFFTLKSILQVSNK